MKKLVRAAVAAAVLSVGAASPAFADLVLPSTGASGAALTLFDSQNQRSLIVSLNVGYNDLLPSIMNQETGYSIANAVNASDQGGECRTGGTGGAALPNPASVALHEKLGFSKVAEFREVGFKFGRWIDVAYWELML